MRFPDSNNLRNAIELSRLPGLGTSWGQFGELCIRLATVNDTTCDLPLSEVHIIDVTKYCEEIVRIESRAQQQSLKKAVEKFENIFLEVTNDCHELLRVLSNGGNACEAVLAIFDMRSGTEHATAISGLHALFVLVDAHEGLECIYSKIGSIRNLLPPQSVIMASYAVRGGSAQG